MAIIGKLVEAKYGDAIYAIFRIGIGALFLMLGVQKVFGLWGMPGGAATLGSLVWFAGMGELLIGLALVVGVLVRLASFFGVIEMIVAYIIGHALTGGWNPAVNMGMPALVFMLAFLVTLSKGAGIASLEKAAFGKEYF